MGGADAGEVASQYASERVHHHYFSKTNEADWGKRMLAAFHAANKDLRAFAAERDKSRMATTMVGAVIRGNHLTFVNVGDSRGYHWRNGTLQQITKDHSLVAKLLEEGVLTPEQAKTYNRTNVIIYSLGSEHEPQIDTFAVDLQAGDIILLCSDGLTRHVTDEEIATMLPEPKASIAAEKMVRLANERGGQDNISATVIRFNPDGVKSGADKPKKKKGTGFLSRLFLWSLTGVLSVLQSAGIFYIWFKLFI